jgi:hypothetical protein
MKHVRPKLEGACLDAASKAAGEALTRAEIDAAWNRLNNHRAKLLAAGDPNAVQKTKAFAEREAERTKIAAAMSRRHAALNIMVRDRVDNMVASLIRQGLQPHAALRALLEGAKEGVEGGRNSVYATAQSYEGRYIGGLLAQIQRERPHLVNALMDKQLDGDVAREMAELKPDGKPGVTGNKDAQYLAKVFGDFAEMARLDLNKLGASIGKLLGWAGSQTHDELKMMKAGKDAWVRYITPKLDMARTMPDAEGPDEIKEVLEGIYDTIITGLPEKRSAAEKGKRVNPANLAKSLGKSRVLHFNNADDALAYREEFGTGTTMGGILSHLQRSARMAGAMTVLGPNPDMMFGSLVESAKRAIKNNASLDDATKNAQIDKLNSRGGQLRQALDIALGLHSVPVNVTGASIGQGIRNAQSMAKLGGAVFASLGGDQMTAAAAASFRGSGFFKGLVNQLDALRRGRPKGELAELSYLLNEGVDGMLGQITSPHAAIDGVPGLLGNLTEKFFKFNGLSFVTDIGRAAVGRMLAAEFAMRSVHDWDNLPTKYRHVLSLHSINREMWEAIRQIDKRQVEGGEYITPDMARGLSDEAVIPTVADRIQLADVSLRTRQIAARMEEAKEAEWIAGRRKRLDEWQAGADKRLEQVMGGNEVRTAIEKQIAERRIAIEKAEIEASRTELEMLSAAKSDDAVAKVRELLIDARGTRQDIEGLGDRAEAAVERLSDADFRGGRDLGIRFQRARSDIRRLRKEIADVERKSSNRDKEAIQRVNETFQKRMKEFNSFMDRSSNRSMARSDALAKDVEAHPKRIADIIEQGRMDIEMAMRRMVADETSFGIVEMDARARRTTTLGLQPGTVSGEAIRFLMQFKGFPIAFMQRVGGRAFYGHHKDASGLEKAAHIGTLLVSMTMAGYLSMTLKDIMRGYWPPRAPWEGYSPNLSTLGAAFIQGGAAGIYGDFLFGKVNRFGGGLLETTAGPTVGAAEDLVQILINARDAGLSSEEELRLSRIITFATQNTPYLNLFYVRPAVDYLFLNAVREITNPGYLRGVERKRMEEYGQENLVRQTIGAGFGT